MSDNWQADVTDFHRKFNVVINTRPTPDGKLDIKGENIPLRILRRRLIMEEAQELCDALDANDLPQIADGIADLIVVSLGTAVSYGIHMQPVWDMVHQSNMMKANGGMREDGKVLKPAGWQHPDIAAEIRRQQEQ